MKISVFVERSGETKLLDVASISEVFEELKINPETVIIALNGKLVTKSASLNDNDKVELLSVISGG